MLQNAEKQGVKPLQPDPAAKSNLGTSVGANNTDDRTVMMGMMQLLLNSQNNSRRYNKRRRVETAMDRFEKTGPRLGGDGGEKDVAIWLVKVEDEGGQLGLLGEENFVATLKQMMATKEENRGKGSGVNWRERHENILNKKSYRAARRDANAAMKDHNEAMDDLDEEASKMDPSAVVSFRAGRMKSVPAKPDYLKCWKLYKTLLMTSDKSLLAQQTSEYLI